MEHSRALMFPEHQYCLEVQYRVFTEHTKPLQALYIDLHNLKLRYQEGVMSFLGNRWIVMVSYFFTVLTVLWMGSSISLAEKTESLTPDMLTIQGRLVRSDAPYDHGFQYLRRAQRPSRCIVNYAFARETCSL